MRTGSGAAVAVRTASSRTATSPDTSPFGRPPHTDAPRHHDDTWETP
jgi:hypothetical protein